MIVLDASAGLDWLLQTRLGLKIEERIYSRLESLHAPHLLDVEIAQVLRRMVLGGMISAQRASEAIDDLANARIHRYPHDLLLPRIWQLRHNLSPYDAAYVALAEALKAVLVTRDGRLASAATRMVAVEVF